MHEPIFCRIHIKEKSQNDFALRWTEFFLYTRLLVISTSSCTT